MELAYRIIDVFSQTERCLNINLCFQNTNVPHRTCDYDIAAAAANFSGELIGGFDLQLKTGNTD